MDGIGTGRPSSWPEGSRKAVSRSRTRCAKPRRAACARASTRCRTGPHCTRMIGWWPSLRATVAESPSTWRAFGSSRRLRDGGASGRMEHPGAEQLESGATVHGALDRLEAADLALDGTRRPRRLERGPDGRQILPETLAEAPAPRPGPAGR